jgi:hypothetical protein
MRQTPSAKHLHQLIRYPDAELRPTSTQQGEVVNDHMTLNLVATAPVDSVIGGLIGHYAGEKLGDGINSVIDSHMDNG